MLDTDMPAQALRLHMGEMTAQEERTARAAIRWANAVAAAEIERLRADKSWAYTERNQIIAALSKLFPAGVARTDIPGWDPEWYGCVYIDLPTGQVSWHFHDDDARLFSHLGPYNGEWDGHDTPEKYRRLSSL